LPLKQHHKIEKKQKQKQGVCHTSALLFTLKSILRQKQKHYGNSNISPCKNLIFKKSCKTNQNPSRYYNSITNLKFQHKTNIIFHVEQVLTFYPFFAKIFTKKIMNVENLKNSIKATKFEPMTSSMKYGNLSSI
jgi:hypothetical protein